MHTLLARTHRRRLMAQLMLCGGLLASGLAAMAGEQRVWQIHEFSRIELVAREAGSEPNQHPARLTPEAVREQLARVQLVAQGERVALFAADEAAELAGPLSRALERATPADDVLLLSSARRESGLLASPTAVTARLFVQGGALQLIVRDARNAFYDTYRGTNTPPRFAYGTRSAAGKAVLEATGATNRRADWIALGAAPAAATPPATAPATTPTTPPAAKPAEPAPDASAEQRLETLKRLRDRKLITEDEYQHKRKEILQQL